MDSQHVQTASRRWFAAACAVIAFAFLVQALLIARHWPLVHDEPIMHYVVFLMAHGFAPYRDIIDMQMPGSYLTDELVIRVLGPGAGGELLWDLLNGLVVMFAALWIVGKEYRAAAIVAGSLAYLWHLQGGAWIVGERDWTVTMLLFLSVGGLLQFLRGNRVLWAGFAFLCAGLAASIKPPAVIVTFACAVVVMLYSRRNALRMKGAALASVVGLLIPIVVVVLFILRFHVLHDFLVSTTQLTTYYAGLQRHSVFELVRMVKMPAEIAVAALAFFLLNRSWRSVESRMLLIAVLGATLMYVLQGKGFSYHTYPMVSFLLLWVALELQKSLNAHWPLAVAGGVVLLALIVKLSLFTLVMERHAVYPMGTVNSLQQDLTAMNDPNLSGHIQCLDMTLGGCLTVLYQMKLVQTTGYISDFYLFPAKATPLTESYQRQFYQLITANPPKVIVLSSHTWPGDTEGYEQLSNFPVLEHYLETDYVVTKEYPVNDAGLAGYKIYTHK